MFILVPEQSCELERKIPQKELVLTQSIAHLISSHAHHQRAERTHYCTEQSQATQAS